MNQSIRLGNIVLKILKRIVRVLAGMSCGGLRYSLNIIYILILPPIISALTYLSKIYLKSKHVILIKYSIIKDWINNERIRKNKIYMLILLSRRYNSKN